MSGHHALMVGKSKSNPWWLDPHVRCLHHTLHLATSKLLTVSSNALPSIMYIYISLTAIQSTILWVNSNYIPMLFVPIQSTCGFYPMGQSYRRVALRAGPQWPSWWGWWTRKTKDSSWISSSPWRFNVQPSKATRDFTTQKLCAWWLTYPSEKYDFVSWDFLIPNIWKIQIVPNHQPGFDADLTNIGESSETLARKIEQK